MTFDSDVERVARALARSHGLGDHRPNIEPWKPDARIAVETLATPAIRDQAFEEAARDTSHLIAFLEGVLERQTSDGVSIVRALKGTSPSPDLLKEQVEAIREELRVMMLEQPNSGRRETYSDGFAQGLCHAIGQIDAILKVRGTKE